MHREHVTKYAAMARWTLEAALRRRQSDEADTATMAHLDNAMSIVFPPADMYNYEWGPSRDPVGLPSGCPRRDTPIGTEVGPGGCRDATKAGPKATAAAATSTMGIASSNVVSGS